MFIRSVKLKRPMLWAAIAAVLIVTAAVFLIGAARKESAPVYSMTTEAERQRFIADMGWKTSEKYTECRSVTIPAEWNEVYEQYNKLQKQQGFDLEKFKGKTVEVYTYPVLNYEGHTDKGCMQLTLMVCSGELIGGDVCCTELDGFMQGLKKSAK